jgi:peptide deformylase
MALREIIILPDKQLRSSQACREGDGGIRKLADDMFETMYNAPRHWLAAIQGPRSRCG